MIEMAIRDNNHDAVHRLANIGMLGCLGGITMRNMNEAWTVGLRNRARDAWAPGHTANQLASVAAGPPPGARAPPPGDSLTFLVPEILKIGCVTCFSYLCRHQIIFQEGFDAKQRSYLALTTTDRNGSDKIPLSIIRDMSVASLFSPQSLTFAGVRNQWPKDSSIFKLVAPFERVAKEYIARVQTTLLVGDPAPNYSVLMDARAFCEMGRWIDPDTANLLLSWNLNVSLGRHIMLGTIWHRLISSRNPHRHAMFDWLSANGIASSPSINDVDPTEHAKVLAGDWPPLAIAILLGDSAAVESLCSQPGITIDATGTFGLIEGGVGLGLVTIGVGGGLGVRNNPLADEAANALIRWILLAAPEMEANGNFSRLLDILEAVLLLSASARRSISAEPAGAVPARLHKASQTRRRKAVITRALSVIRTIQSTPFRTLTFEADGSVTVTRMFERPAYQTWLLDVKRRMRVGCNDVTQIWAALDRGNTRIPRSGGDPMDTDS